MKRGIRFLKGVFFSGAWALTMLAPFSGFAMDCETAAGLGYDIHTQRASAALDPDILNQAREYYEKALELCPDYCEKTPVLCNNLGDVYLRVGNRERATVYFKKAVEIRPDYGDAWFELGNIYMVRGRLGLALDAFLKASEANPEDKEAQASARAATEKLCAKSNYRKVAEEGEVLDPEEIADGLLAGEALKKANDRFHVCQKDIFVSGTCLRNILFETGSARLLGQSDPQLDAIGRMMAENAKMQIAISGHTDSRPVGGRLEVLPGVFCDDNVCLSQKRAESVKRELEKRGVSSGRLSSEGFGATRSADGRDLSKNRRVELELK